jgi:two-component system KDP operon response regulator KdpE
MDELTARIRALLRRADADDPAEPAIAVGHYIVDLASKTVRRAPGAPDGVPEQVRLTKTEWAVLEMLMRNPGRLVSGKQLLQQIWGPAYQSETNYLRFYLAKLRQKLEPEPSHPRHLLTEPGMGYRFQP